RESQERHRRRAVDAKVSGSSAAIAPPCAEPGPIVPHLLVLARRHGILAAEWRAVLFFVEHEQSECRRERLLRTHRVAARLLGLTSCRSTIVRRPCPNIPWIHSEHCTKRRERE